MTENIFIPDVYHCRNIPCVRLGAGEEKLGSRNQFSCPKMLSSYSLCALELMDKCGFSGQCRLCWLNLVHQYFCIVFHF